MSFEAAPRSSGPLPALTGIRGIAATWLMLGHFQLAFALQWGSQSLRNSLFLGSGYLGVDLFFILSGFILAYTHLEDFRQCSRTRLARFACLRLLRIYPTCLCVMLLLFCLVWAMPSFDRFLKISAFPLADYHRLDLAANVLLVENWWGTIPVFNRAAWSLSQEILAYLCFPLLAFGIARFSSKRLCLGMAIVLLLGLPAFMTVYGYAHRNLTWAPYASCRMAPTFIAGMLLARFFRLHDGAWWRWTGTFCVALIGLSLSWPPAWPLLYAACGGLILSLAKKQDYLARLCAMKPILLCGEISFSLYLTHTIVIDLTGFLLAHYLTSVGRGGQRLIMIAGGLACFAVAYAVHRGFEKPMQAAGRRWLDGALPPVRRIVLPENAVA